MIQSTEIFGMQACGSATGTAGGAVPLAGGQRLYGVVAAGVVRNSAGNYNIQLTDPITEADGFIAITPIGTPDIVPELVSWSAGGLLVIQLNTGGGAATDAAFSFIVFRTTRPSS